MTHGDHEEQTEKCFLRQFLPISLFLTHPRFLFPRLWHAPSTCSRAQCDNNEQTSWLATGTCSWGATSKVKERCVSVGSGVRWHGKRDQYVTERRSGIAKTRKEKGRKHLSQVALCFQQGRNMREEGANLNFNRISIILLCKWFKRGSRLCVL